LQSKHSDHDQSTLSNREDRTMRKFFAVTMGSVVALVGFASAANASATVDLIWIDNTDTACTDPNRRDCPQLGTTLSSVAVTDNITLGVIITAGPGGVVGAGVSVDYSNVLPLFSVNNFGNFTTITPDYWLIATVGVTSDMPPFIDNINALSFPYNTAGIGLPAGQSAYLGTVSFHMDQLGSGIFEIDVGAFGPRRTDGIGDLAHQDITSTTTFNSAFVPEPSALTALGSGIAMLVLLYRRRTGVNAHRPPPVNRRPHFPF
jgi:hypothetical protein